MAAESIPKYTRWEHERRFVVSRDAPRSWEQKPAWEIEDRYLEAGRLRLRSIRNLATGEMTFKLCKKFPSDSVYSQPIVNIYLSEPEYAALLALPGRDLRKLRFHHRVGEHTFGIDVFGGALDGLVLCETEAPTLRELMAIDFPRYAQREVTEDARFSGGELSRTSAAELAIRLASLS